MKIDEISPNCLYFIKESFFDFINDPFLKKNKEDTFRPHYFAFVDEETSLCWMIPCSTKIEKYESIIQEKIKNNKKHNHIQIIKVSGKKQAFLFQDMFPISPNYIEKPYENKYGVLSVADPKLVEEINENAKKIIKLLRKGIKFTPTQPNITLIEEKLLITK